MRLGGRILAAADISQAECLVVDIELGDILGTEMVRELWLRGYSVPVIFMTGSPNDVFRQPRRHSAARIPAEALPAEDLLQAIDRATARSQGYRKCA